MAVISVSILDMDFLRLEEGLMDLRALGIRRIHLDVVDTSFAANISFGPGVLNQVLRLDFDFDLHLMLARPLAILRQLDLVNVSLVAVHSEFSQVRSFLEGTGTKAGLAIGPDEDVLGEDVSNSDYILVMTVQPGFGGQRLIQDCVRKISRLKLTGKLVGVDGGVNAENIALLGGADIIVVGSALTKSGNMKEYYGRLKAGLGQ